MKTGPYYTPAWRRSSRERVSNTLRRPGKAGGDQLPPPDPPGRDAASAPFPALPFLRFPARERRPEISSQSDQPKPEDRLNVGNMTCDRMPERRGGTTAPPAYQIAIATGGCR